MSRKKNAIHQSPASSTKAVPNPKPRAWPVGAGQILYSIEAGVLSAPLFDRWASRDVGKILINHFETLVAQQAGLGSQLCIYDEFCGKAMAIEHDGSVYACDHYVYPEYRLGNIRDGQLHQLAFSRAQVQFGYAKNETLPRYCRECDYLSACWGECPKNRVIRTADGDVGLNYLCRGLKAFFAHALPEVRRIAASVRARSAASLPAPDVRSPEHK
jgi:uncharacterized protein